MRPIGDTLEKTVTTVIIMAFGGSVLPVMLMNGGALPAGDQEGGAVMLFFAAIYLAIIALIVVRPRLAIQVPLVSPLLTGLVVLTLISALWSLHPDITMRRAIAFLFTTTFAVYLGLRWSLAQTLTMLAIGLGLLVVLSYVFIVAVPDIGIDHFMHEGAWKGVFFQKNVTGRMLVWLILSLLWLDWNGYGRRWLMRGLLGLSLVLLPMCQSGTALVTTVLVVGVLTLVQGLRGHVRLLVPAVAIVAFALVAAAMATGVFYKDMLALLGRDITLTGRTELWEHTTMSLRDHWTLGFGFGAYWWGDNGPAAAYTEGWGITSAHNGWIEVMLDLGLPGLVLMALLMLKLLGGGVLAARYGDPRRETAWILAVALGQLTISISESLFMERHSLNWVVLVVCVVRVSLLWRAGARAPSRGSGGLHAPA